MSAAGVFLLLLLSPGRLESQVPEEKQPSVTRETYDIVVVGATPAGVAAALAAARLGSRVALVDAGEHVGGMFSGGGMCYSDLWIRNSEGAIFREYTRRVRKYYAPQSVITSSDFSYAGYFWEPSVAETVFKEMLREEPNLSVLLGRRLASVLRKGNFVAGAHFEMSAGREELLLAQVFIDATYEGDLAALAGSEYRVGRERRGDFDEQHAGRIYQDLVSKKIYPGSTGEGDERFQAYNFLLVVTNDPQNCVAIQAPPDYQRSYYITLLEDLRLGHVRSINDIYTFIPMPGNKFALNNSYKASVSADFPGGNRDYPETDQQGRQHIAQRHLNHTLGLLHFLQTDPEVPAGLRQAAQQWGLAGDEFVENGHLPWQMYVREGRRIVGEYTFTESDGRIDPKNQLRQGEPESFVPPWMYPQFPNLPETIPNRRPPIHSDSVAVATYFFDSHATSPWEPGHEENAHVHEGVVHLEHLTLPSQLPYRIMVPKKIDGLLVPVAVSATHVGFSTIRMEPVWMALGQAAGTAAFLASSSGVSPRDIPVRDLQMLLVRQGHVVTFFGDVTADHPHFTALQYFGTKGFFPGFTAWPEKPVTWGLALRWLSQARKRPEAETKLIVVKPSVDTFDSEAQLSRETALAWARQLYADSPSLFTSITADDWLLSDVSGPLEQVDLPVTRSELCQLLYLLETANSKPGQRSPD